MPKRPLQRSIHEGGRPTEKARVVATLRSDEPSHRSHRIHLFGRRAVTAYHLAVPHSHLGTLDTPGHPGALGSAVGGVAANMALISRPP